jgi:hypothetical protein
MSPSDLEAHKALLGSDYDPHGGRKAIRREAQFHTWVASGRDQAEFAPATEAEREAVYSALLGSLGVQ